MVAVTKLYDGLMQRQSVKSWIYVLLGSIVLSAGFVLFMNPYKIVPGGVYGTGIVLHSLFPSIQVGTFGLMLDIPLLLIGFKVFGRMFGAKTIFSALLIPAVMNGMTYLIGENPSLMFGGNMDLSQDMFLPCIFGGVMIGTGTGLIIKSHATSGGTDIIAMLLTHYAKFRFSRAILLVDSTIVIFGMIVLGDWRLPLDRLHRRRRQLRQAAVHRIRPQRGNPRVHPRKNGPRRHLHQEFGHVHLAGEGDDFRRSEPQRGVDDPEHDPRNRPCVVRRDRRCPRNFRRRLQTLPRKQEIKNAKGRNP